ncbi:MAG: phospholipase D-like domain-containing protein [Syntrophorhabdaceae bacterium]
MRRSNRRQMISQKAFSSVAWAEQFFSRTSGAPVSAGNEVKVLRDAAENYPAWLESMRTAEKWIHFENYIIREDSAGREFADVLAAKAREGIKVRIVYDWLGCLGKASPHFWQMLRKAGVEVRCFNPPRFDSPLGWVTRDHRKMIGIDGKVAFVTGLCIGRMWVGDPGKSIDPWRDTGIQVVGPAVADIEAAFSQIWFATGEPVPAKELPDRKSIAHAGDVPLRVVASTPNTGNVYRLDQQIAALARKSLWLTDAYYMGTTAYIHALKSTAMDGVDVRLLVPGATDIPIMRTISRAGYKPLLEAGVRVFEWNGTMIHAKTAVADGYWARVGSTNLNLASWIQNYELDVVIENEDFAREMEEMYLSDIGNSTEVVLTTRYKRHFLDGHHPKSGHLISTGKGSMGKVGAGAIRIGNAVGAAITNRRVLGPAELRIPLIGGMALLILTVLCILIPRSIALPIAFVCAWLGIAMLIKAWRLYQMRSSEMNKGQEEEEK